MSRTKDDKTNKNQNTSQEQIKEQEMTFPYYDWINGSYYRNKEEYDVHAPNNILWKEVSQKTLNEVNKKYNLGYKVDKKGNVVRNKYTHSPIYTDGRENYPEGEEYNKLYENNVETNKRRLELEKTAKIKTKPSSTDRVLDYLGYDLGYNKGGTKAMYNGAYQLPEVTITPNGNYTELIPNELGTGWMYRNRAGRFDNFNYDYVDRYERNQKALGGNLFRNGSWMPNKQWQNRISAWEGSSMYRPAPDTGRVNSSFQAEDSRFLSVLPKKALQKLPEQAINALYSYSYNVGSGTFKK